MITQNTTDCHKEAIERLLKSGCCFALYRTPYSDAVELVMQLSDKAATLTESSLGIEGFVFAPFYEEAEKPSLLIRADKTAHGWDDVCSTVHSLETTFCPELRQLPHSNAHDEAAQDSKHYHSDFARMLSAIQEGRFEKLVLSYCQCEKDKHLHGHEAEVFLKALTEYRSAMVYMVYTSQSGLWMGCTPELLLSRKDNEWHTVALAGTRQNVDQWDTKNIHEQDVVTTYIRETLLAMGADVELSPCDTLNIGHLSHRRTRFSFSFSTPKATLDVARTLHPTPAICGVPKSEAMDFLLQNEHTDRNYFSGYLGKIEPNGDAQLFVNLRCAQVTDAHTYYHAGGGLTYQSLLEDEGKEIDLKIATLKKLL